MINQNELLTQRFSGIIVERNVLIGRGYLHQNKKITHEDIPEKENIWVRDIVCPDSCQEAHMLLALSLNKEYCIQTIYTSVRFYFSKKSYEDADIYNFPPETASILVNELNKTLASVYVPKGYNPIGLTLPKMLREATWFPVGDGESQWRCEVDENIWNCHPPKDPENTSTILCNNTFFTTISSQNENNTNLVIYIHTNNKGNISDYEVEKCAQTGMFSSSSYLKTNKKDDQTAKLLFIEMDYSTENT